MPSRRIPLSACPHHDERRITTTAKTRCATCPVTEHLRLCTTCGEVFCCESSNAHNRQHYQETGHPLIVSVPADDPHSFTWCWICNAYLVAT